MVGSVRARIGYSFDDVLIYGTGGFAFANLEIENQSAAGSDSATLPGWTAGLGAECLWGEHATLFTQYSEFSQYDFKTLPSGQTKVGAGINIFGGGIVYIPIKVEDFLPAFLSSQNSPAVRFESSIGCRKPAVDYIARPMR
jgi:opacity protein-like surface antigen